MPVTGTLTFRNGKLGFKLDPNQKLGTDCHKLTLALLPGVAAKREKWDDPKDIETEDAYTPQSQQAYNR